MISAINFRTLVAFAIAIVSVFAISSLAMASHTPEDYSLFGDAEYISPGNASDRAVHLVSDSDPAYGGIDFGVASGTTFADLTTLSSDFMLEADDACIGGSPRYQIELENSSSTDSGNIFVYFGTDSGGDACVPGTWQNTGDVLEADRLVDSSQLDGGTFYDSYDDALARYADYEVTGIQIVTDSSWIAADGEHAVTIDNTLINSTLITYEIPEDPVATDKDQCKDGGWMNVVDSEGNAFKNQGQCVSFVAKGGTTSSAI